MAAEGVLHDLGVIPMTSSDSQGMGRVGEVAAPDAPERRADEARGSAATAAGHDNERVLRHIAKVTVNPAITHGHRRARRLAAAGPAGGLRRSGSRRSAACGPELVVKAGVSAWGASGDGNATTMLAEPVRVGAAARRARRRARPDLAGVRREARPGRRPADRARARASCAAAATCRPRTWCATPRRGAVRVDPRDARGHARRRARRRRRRRPRCRSRAATCWAEPRPRVRCA